MLEANCIEEDSPQRAPRPLRIAAGGPHGEARTHSMPYHAWGPGTSTW